MGKMSCSQEQKMMFVWWIPCVRSAKEKVQPSVSSGQLTLRPLNCLMVPWPRCGSRPAPSSSWPLSDRGAHGCATIPLGKLQKSQSICTWVGFSPHGSPRNLVVPVLNCWIWMLPLQGHATRSWPSVTWSQHVVALKVVCHCCFPWPVSGNLRNSFGSSMKFHWATLIRFKNCREGSFWLRFAEFRFEEEPSEALLMMCLWQVESQLNHASPWHIQHSHSCALQTGVTRKLCFRLEGTCGDDSNGFVFAAPQSLFLSRACTWPLWTMTRPYLLTRDALYDLYGLI